MAELICSVGGQGIASGFRDAISLAWRLALLCHHHPTTPQFHEQVLAAWYRERKQQLERSLASTIENGKFVCEAHFGKILVRDWYLWLVQLVPSWKRHLQLGQRKDGLIRYVHYEGMPFMPGLNGGLNLPQVFCTDTNGKPFFTDDVIFRFLRAVEELSRGEVAADHVPFVIEKITKHGAEDDRNLFQIASAEEFAQSPLCRGRPEPAYYEPFLIRTEARAKYIIVRPDRVVFAACEDEQSLKTAMSCMKDILRC
ncbi:monooxygenase [Aspergillus arachidicola]|uniref:Monooxygenase n=1 Tax=Aspergillus arachidicola TaxID=656916 RepID=A0A2G7G196_9EURO|nr:monooxygenase [Aspergillus arachidicola]